MNTDLVAQKAIDKLNRDGFDQLSETEKTTVTVWLFEGQVQNRGFARFFAHATGDVAFHAPAALQTIGALQMAEIAAKANSVFGANGPPRERNARKALVEAFTETTRKELRTLEGIFFECHEDVDELLEKYLVTLGSGNVSGENAATKAMG